MLFLVMDLVLTENSKKICIWSLCTTRSLKGTTVGNSEKILNDLIRRKMKKKYSLEPTGMRVRRAQENDQNLISNN